MKRPTEKQLKRAIEILHASGRTHFCETADPSVGQCLAAALPLDADECVNAALYLLESWNGHLSVAAVGAIERGYGRVSRNGRELTITLPKHWEKL